RRARRRRRAPGRRPDPGRDPRRRWDHHPGVESLTMAWAFSDSFDLYAAIGDELAGYWDSGAGAGLVAGRFAGSQAISIGTSQLTLTKSSGVNDAVHHLVCAFKQTAALSGSTLGMYFELFDSATAQCSIVFRSDGAILLTSGAPAGTVLATYTGAVTAQNTWFAFEFEVTINNTTGGFAVRKNGAAVNDFSAASLDTQNSANAYANKLSIGMQGAVNSQLLDDLFWRSDAASVAWMGDIRCFARMPVSDASVTFSRSPSSPITLPPFSTGSSVGVLGAGTPRYSGFVSQGGNLTSVV